MEISKLNPNQVVKKQHIFPRKSLARFCDESGVILVATKDGTRVFPANTNNIEFWNCRVWNEHAESVTMKKIEDRYQRVAEKALKDLTLDADDHLSITEMFALWKYRSEVSKTPPPKLAIKGYPSVTSHNKAEVLEKSGLYFYFNGEFSSQMMAGLGVLYAIKETSLRLGEATKWGVLSAISGEFVIPDQCPDIVVIPLSPTKLLTAQKAENSVDEAVVSVINEQLIKCSEKHYYYRRL